MVIKMVWKQRVSYAHHQYQVELFCIQEQTKIELILNMCILLESLFYLCK